jgi:hypothetical protein
MLGEGGYTLGERGLYIGGGEFKSWGGYTLGEGRGLLQMFTGCFIDNCEYNITLIYIPGIL